MLISGSADGLRAFKVEHSVEDVAGDPGFDLLHRLTVGVQGVSLLRIGGSSALCVDRDGKHRREPCYTPHRRENEQALFLPGCRIAAIKRTGSGTLLVVAHSRRNNARCRDCGVPSRAVHSRYRRSPADFPAIGRSVRIDLTVRRFYCREASCPRRTFAERFGLAVAPFARQTRRLGKALGRIGTALGGEAGARLA